MNLRIAILAAALAACTPVSSSFVCTNSSQCVIDGQQGRCEASTYCSFPSMKCAPQFQYQGSAGELSGQCVASLDMASTDLSVGLDLPQRVRFHTAERVPTAATPCAVAAGPLDGDSRPDVAVATCASGKVQVYFTAADGSLPKSPSYTSTIAADASAVLIANVTGSASLDLVIADRSSGTVSALPGDGAGGFGSPVVLLTKASVDVLATADFDHDGVMDVVAGSSIAPGLVLKRSAASSAQVLATQVLEARVLTTDVNHDGWADLVGLAPSGTLVVELNVGESAPGTFAAPLTSTYSVGVDLASASFNADAYPDFFVLQGGGSDGFDSYVIPSGGAGTGDFGPQIDFEIASTHLATGALRVLIADVDGDGTNDLVASFCPAPSVSLQSGVRIHWGLTAGALPTPELLASTLYATESCPTAMTSAHLVDAQHLDLIIANSSSGTLSIIHGESGQATSAATTILPTVSGTRMYDFNGDGKLDLVYGDANGLELAAGDGAGHFKPVAFTAYQGQIAASAVADMNNDGKLDLVYATTDFHFYVALGTGPGTFATPLAFPLNTTGTAQIVDLAIAEFTGDKNLDLLLVDGSESANTTLSNLVLEPGKGNGAFYLAPEPYSAPNASRVAIADLNGDQLADAVALTTDGNAYPLLRDPKKSLDSLPKITAEPTSGRGLVLVDVNYDGHVDLLAAGDSLNVLYGKGDGTFLAAQILLAAETYGVGAGDFDDGLLRDVVAISNTDIYVGDGTGRSFFFGDPTGYTFAAGDGDSSVLVGDINGDGLADVVVGGVSTTVVLNNTP
jgi:FG-GAP-like repeat